MVDEADAAALVVYAAEKLALQGHSPVINHENGPRLMRLAEQMLDAFGLGTTLIPPADTDKEES